MGRVGWLTRFLAISERLLPTQSGRLAFRDEQSVRIFSSCYRNCQNLLRRCTIITWALLVIILLLVVSNGSRLARMQKSVDALQADVDRLSGRQHVDEILDR